MTGPILRMKNREKRRAIYGNDPVKHNGGLDLRGSG